MAARVALGVGSPNQFSSTSGTLTEDTTSGTFNSSWADCSIRINFANWGEKIFTDEAGAADAAAAGEIIHVRADHVCNVNLTSTASNMLELRNSSGPWVVLKNTAAATWGLYVNTNTGASPTYVQKGSNFTVSTTRLTLNLVVTIGSPHTVTALVNNVVVATGSFTNAALTSLDRVRVLGYADQNSACWSQIRTGIDKSMIGAFLKTCRPNGAGSGNTLTSGTYTDIDEPVLNNADFMVSNTAAQAFDFAMQDVTVGTGMEIDFLVVETILKSDLTSPANFAAKVKSSASITDQTAFAASVGFAGNEFRCSLDPATGVKWTQSGWNAATVGGTTS